MLKVWNVTLICGTFALALLGTFLVRSGMLQSIHAFGESTVGPPMLGLIAVVVLASALLIVSRLDDLRSDRRIESLLSRESIFLVNNLLLVGLAGVILWGTLFPLISEAVTGEKASVAAPWFDRYTTPLAILLVLFTGIGPLFAWRRVSPGAEWRLLARPAVVGIATAIALFLLTDARSKPLALAMFALATFTLAALVQEFARGAAAYRSLAGGTYGRALVAVFSRNRRRYGGYVPHAGLALLLIAVAASSSFKTSRDLRLRPGQSASVATTGRPMRGALCRSARPSSGSRSDRCLGSPRTASPTRSFAPRATTTPGPVPRSPPVRCATSSKMRRRARSDERRPSAATYGPRCSPTSLR